MQKYKISFYSNDFKLIPYFKSIVLFISLFAFNLNAQDLTAGQATWQQYVPAWFPLFAIAVGIGYGITGIAFMLSRFFTLPKLESWARNELFEVTSSVFLVLIILISLGIIDNVFIAVAKKTPMSHSLDFTKSITNELMDRYVESVKLGAAIGILSGPPVQFLGDTKQNPAKKGTGSSKEEEEKINRIFLVAIKHFRIYYLPFYGTDVFNGHFNLIQSITLTSLGISILSHAILQFISMIAIPVVIPLGLLLSMFAFSRKMGRTLIAFGVGLYIFVPLSIIIAQTMYDSAFKPNTAVPQIERPSGGNDIDTFSNRLLGLNIADFLIHLVLGAAAVSVKGGLAFVPACATGASILSSICFVGAPACAVVFTAICSLFAGFSDTGQVSDTISTLLTVVDFISLQMLSHFLNVAISDQIVTIFPYISSIIALTLVGIISLALVGITSSLIFHIIPSNVLTINYLITILNTFIKEGAYFLSLIGASFYLELNRALAIKLTDITLAYTPYIMQYAVPVMLIPFIMIFLVITGIRSLSPAIGGEVQILGVSELI